MTEHQIHILTRVILAIVFLLAMIALFAFMSRRRAKTNSGKADKAEKIELLNFDEARRRKNNRLRRHKNGGRKN
jgi:preprotein translocase subunit SecG